MIGALRERITFERPEIAEDGTGGGVLTWVAAPAPATVWARVEAMTGDETVAADQREAHVTYRITVRRCDQVTHDWRAVWRGRALDILAVLPGERRAYLVLLARAGGAQ